ncbi:hypothetical protein D7T64_23635, partial [Salmonella enterica]|nr:hypothetical protein [Salmonella enterica]
MQTGWRVLHRLRGNDFCTNRRVRAGGDALPVSALPPDGTWPMGTTRWEKRNIAEEIPVWKEELCTQCN